MRDGWAMFTGSGLMEKREIRSDAVCSLKRPISLVDYFHANAIAPGHWTFGHGTLHQRNESFRPVKIPNCFLAFNDRISFTLSLSLSLPPSASSLRVWLLQQTRSTVTLSRLRNPFSTFQRGKKAFHRSPLRNWFLGGVDADWSIGIAWGFATPRWR